MPRFVACYLIKTIFQLTSLTGYLLTEVSNIRPVNAFHPARGNHKELYVASHMK